MKLRTCLDASLSGAPNVINRRDLAVGRVQRFNVIGQDHTYIAQRFSPPIRHGNRSAQAPPASVIVPTGNRRQERIEPSVGVLGRLPMLVAHLAHVA